MLKKKKKKIYDFKYIIHWKDGTRTIGEITHSELPPEDIFLTDTFTYFAKGISAYFNTKEIKQLEITDLVEKVE